MTPKQKAEELFNKMNKRFFMVEQKHMRKHNAKQCALIAVDEIIKNKPSDLYGYTDTLGYWQEVKQEILNI